MHFDYMNFRQKNYQHFEIEEIKNYIRKAPVQLTGALSIQLF